MSHELRVRAYSAPWRAGVDFLIKSKPPGCLASVVTSMTMTTVEDGKVIEPSFRLETEEAQALMDDLWACGLRPTEGTGSAGSLAATQAHLKDLQNIVNKTLDAAIGGGK